MHDPVWFRMLLWLHIAAGSCSFVLAPVALMTVKGGKAHRRWGKIYFFSMTTVAASALILALYRPVLFLALVSVFSFYTAFLGYRVLQMKSVAVGGQVDLRWDWAVAVLTFLSSLSLAFLALFRPIAVQGLVIPGVIFGLLGMQVSGEAMWGFLHPPTDRMFWWCGHMRGMIGSYIAAWSAFSVVTLGRYFGDAWYIWLWPTMVGFPAIALSTAYYKRKFARVQRPAPAAAA
jgi:uncharacterized membrane protein